ncbi:MAG: Gfo/Idh/MocA family oxidoreductase [Armatimonadota bacterium]|nr:Gfo/Idh/MocA family oxidoreductase [bacterium]MDW8319928.1 Gfo/Idh/MocA family oxidoreductase [Armatimonadota bacterium]
MSKRTLNVALIGYQFMGKAHSNAYRQVARFFDDLEVEPVLKVICGRNEQNVQRAAQKYGWEEYDTSWERVVERKDIDLVDVSVPGNMHAPIAIAAANAGKMVLCEKPLANTLAEARQMYEAVQKNGVPNALCHNYRFAPAVQLAKQLIDEGRIGKIYHFRGTYLQDWIVDPNFPLVWRLQKEVAGSGAHGDLNAHLIDMARFLVGEIAEVSGMMETFIKQRPKLAASDDRLGGVASSEMGEVTVDDAALFLVRFENGAIGSIEATRFALGRKNYNRFEINGSKGSLVFNMERMNELEVYLQDDPPHIRGFRVVQASDSMHPFMSAWWPVGHIIGYEHTFTNLVYAMLKAFDKGEEFKPNFEDGVRNQAVLEAVDVSSQQKRWVSISEL